MARRFFTILVLMVFSSGSVLGQSITVWPGDVNGNGEVNHLDILYWAKTLGQSGPARPNPSFFWQADSAAAWPSFIYPGWNTAHADCDGNGIINLTDTNVIGANYRERNLLYFPDVLSPVETLALPLRLVLPADTIFGGDTVSAVVLLGDSQTVVHNFFGLGFSIFSDSQNLFEPGSFRFDINPLWMGPGGVQKTISFFKADAQRADVAIVMANGQGGWATGPVGTVSFVLEDILIGSQIVAGSITIGEVLLLSPQILPMPIGLEQPAGFIHSAKPVSVEERLPLQKIAVWPNPVENTIRVRAEEPIRTISLFSLQGKPLMQRPGANLLRAELNVSALSPGMFILVIETASSVFHHKIIRQ